MTGWDTAANDARKEFKDRVASPNNILTMYDNQGDFEQPSGVSWYRCNIVMGEDFQASLSNSSPRFRNLGMLIIQVFSPEGEGDANNLATANLVRAAFRRFNSALPAKLKFYVPKLVNVGLRGGEWQRNVQCPFDYEDFN